MSDNKNHNLFLLFCLSASIIFVFFIAKPLLAPLIMAGVFAFLFQPIYIKFTNWTKGRVSLSAFLVTTLSVIILIIPIGLIGTMIIKEATDLYKDLSSGDGGIVEKVEQLVINAKSEFPALSHVEFNLNNYVTQGLESLAQNVGSIFSSFAKIILNLFVFLTAFYFFLKDGKRFSMYLIELSPLEDKDDLFIISRFKSAIQATVKGNITISLIQGVVTAVGFTIFGVPNPVLWGSITAVAALIPGIGTALVIVPGIIYLFVSGHPYSGLGLTTWGVLAVGLIDNVLGPRLVGKGMQLHPLAVFVSVLGGMALFGPLGFIFGPLSLSVCLALVDIYFSLKKSHSL